MYTHTHTRAKLHLNHLAAAGVRSVQKKPSQQPKNIDFVERVCVGVWWVGVYTWLQEHDMHCMCSAVCVPVNQRSHTHTHMRWRCSAVQQVRSVCVGPGRLNNNVNGLMWWGLSWERCRFAPSAVLHLGNPHRQTSLLPPALLLRRSVFSNLPFSPVILHLFLPLASTLPPFCFLPPF